jgi:dTDP-4-dehydrorhamnose reductase
MFKRILLLGDKGQVGWEARRSLACLGEVVSLDYPQVDFTHPQALSGLVKQLAPQVIYNAVAYTDVDRAESEPALAQAINAIAPAVLAETARSLNALLIHFSTDYVFDGLKNASYTESDATSPLNVYGQTKLAGEQAIQQIGCRHFIFRTSWVYSLRRGDGFVRKVLEWARQKPVLRIVSDQVGSPTSARALAEITAQILAQALAQHGDLDWLSERSGLYHLAGDGAASRLDWARAILENDPRRSEQVAAHIEPALTAEFPTPAQRPLFSALECRRFISTFALRLPAWQQALQLAMEG